MGKSSVKTSKQLSSQIRVSDLSVTTSKYLDRPVIGGAKNAEKFPERLSQKDISIINKTRKLPSGYLLKYTPKTVSYEYYEGTYMKNTVVPPTYNVIKTGKTPEEIKDVTTTDVLPVGFKFMNIEQGTYITTVHETYDSLTKKVTKKDFMESARNLLSYIFG